MAKPRISYVCASLMAILCCLTTSMVSATYWGDWGKVEYCPNDGKAMGFTLLTEGSQGNGDDTALNAIALKCTSESRIYSTARAYVKEKSLLLGVYNNGQIYFRSLMIISKGKWGGNFFCPAGHYLTSCQLRVESPQGKGDDTSANNLNCKCSNGETLQGDGTHWGEWNGWSPVCRRGICGLQTRVDKSKDYGDNTGLNDVSFLCCN